MCNLENIQLTDITRPVDYDAYWEKWLKVCIEGIIKEHTERQQRSGVLYNPLDQDTFHNANN
jgi:hypothetical protein